MNPNSFSHFLVLIFKLFVFLEFLVEQIVDVLDGRLGRMLIFCEFIIENC